MISSVRRLNRVLTIPNFTLGSVLTSEGFSAMAQRRLDLCFPNMTAACDDVRHLRAVGYELTGNWSLAQILDHLNMSMQMTIDGADFTFPAPLRPIFRLLFARTLRVGKPSKLRGKAPKQIQPRVDLDEDECANQFFALANTLMDPTTVFVPTYPMFGRLDRAQWLMMQQWHSAHHLSFAVPAS